MAKVEKSAGARNDLLDIWLYIAKDSVEAADRYLDMIEATLLDLAGHPGMGPLCPNLGDGVHSFPCGSHIVFYRPAPHGIRVVRILHGAMDIPSAFRN